MMLKDTFAALILSALISFSLPCAADVALPPDVTKFIDHRNLCDHFRGEAGDNTPARESEIDKNIDRYCTGTDRKLAKLKKKYHDNKDVMAALSQFAKKID
jgi:hypothetical protein